MLHGRQADAVEVVTEVEVAEVEAELEVEGGGAEVEAVGVAVEGVKVVEAQAVEGAEEELEPGTCLPLIHVWTVSTSLA